MRFILYILIFAGVNTFISSRGQASLSYRAELHQNGMHHIFSLTDQDAKALFVSMGVEETGSAADRIREFEEWAAGDDPGEDVTFLVRCRHFYAPGDQFDDECIVDIRMFNQYADFDETVCKVEGMTEVLLGSAGGPFSPAYRLLEDASPFIHHALDPLGRSTTAFQYRGFNLGILQGYFQVWLDEPGVIQCI